MCLPSASKGAKTSHSCLTIGGGATPTVSALVDGRLYHPSQTSAISTHFRVRCRQTGSVSVCSCSSLSMHNHHQHWLGSVSGSSRQAEWVKDLPDRHIDQTHRIVGLDPGRKSLFTAAIHSQSAAGSLQDQRTHESTPDSKYTTMSWSSSRWREASGIKFRLHKTQLWFSRNVSLKDALEDTPSAKVATVALLMKHVQHRMRYEAAAVSHFGDRRHRQLRWRTFMKRQQAYSAICRAISAGSQDTVVAYGDASFSSSCNKGNPSTPTVSLRRNLGYHCKVFDTDEFRTSRLCCACKSPMDGMPLPVTGNFLPYANAAPFLLCLTTFGHEGLI